MFEILTIDNSNIFQHFLELAVPLFPIKQVNQTIDVKFIIAGEYVLSIYLLHVPNFEQYKLNARQKVLQFIDTYKNTIIVFIPNLIRVDEKTNKALLQTFELISQDLNLNKMYAREQMTKIIFYENALELNKENCMREFISTIRYQINLYVDQNMKYLDVQINEIKEQHSQGEFVSFYKLFNLTCQKAKLYANLKQLPEALKLYFDFEDLFHTQYFEKKLQNFNSLHPFDFVAKKSIQVITQIFEQSGDESQSTVLDFMILIQAKILDILAILNQTQCLEQILLFSNTATKIVELHKLDMKKANIPDEEQILDIGHLIWQYVNIKNSLAHLSKYPQNLQGLQLLNFQYQTYKIKSMILNVVEKLGNILYQIDFQYSKSFGIIEQCKLLEDSISGKVQSKISQPNKTMITFLMTDLSLRDNLITLEGFIEFYNSTYLDLISQAEQLQASKLKFTYQFNLLKLKNLYPELQLSPQILNEIGTKEPPCQDFPQLYASFLIQQMIHMYRENLQMSFKDNFQSAMQSQLPGQCFTNLFKLLSLPLSRMKDVQFGMFEKFVLDERISYYEYLFKFSIIRYLNIECDGQFRITLKNQHSNRKIKLNTGTISLQESKRQTFPINLSINDLEGIYQITKATFQTGSFKLYLIISSRVESQKLSLIQPTLQLNLNQPISNIGSKYLISLNDIPPNVQSVQVKIVGNDLYHHLQLLEPFIVEKNLDIYEIKGDFQLVNFGVLTLISNQKINNFTIELICQGKSYINSYEQKGVKIVQIKDLSDLIEDEYQLVEAHMLSENKQIIVSTAKGQFILTIDDVRRFHFKRDQVITLQEQQDLAIFKETSLNETQIDKLIKFSFDVNFILQIQQNSQELNIQKSKQILFKIQILTVYNQDQGIPFRQQQYYTVALKIRYLGNEKYEYDFILENVHVKGSKKFSQSFSTQQTIAVHNFQCFLFSIEKPVLSIYSDGIKLIDSAELDYQMQINDF